MIMFRVVFFLSLLYIALSLVNSTNRVCISSSKIKEIGGCNAHYCGVRLEDGTVGEHRRPVIGEEVCYGTKTDYKFKPLFFN